MKFLFYVLTLVFTLSIHAQVDNVVNLKNDFKKALISNNLEDQKSIAIQLKSNYSSKQYAYYTLLLSSVSNNAILITNGINDTYPLRILQLTKGLKTGVNIVSLELLTDKSYNDLKSTELGVTLNITNKSENIKSILNKTGNNGYISTTVDPNYYKGQRLYNLGLVTNGNDNIQLSQLQSFWFQINKVNWKSESLSPSEKLLYQNYLPPLLTLYKLKVYEIDNNKLERVINYLAEKVNKTEVVKQILGTYKN